MAEGKTNMFGKTYNTIGSTDSNFIIKTKGDLKILWGNKYIDVIKNGKIASEGSKILFIVNSPEEIEKNGVYIVTSIEGNELWVCIDGVKIQVTNNSESATYVSFLVEQKATNELKRQALTNIGFYYETLNEAKFADIVSGIIYAEDTEKLYIAKNGILTEYSTGNSIITSEESTTEPLKRLPLYIEDYSLWVDGLEYIKCSGQIILLLMPVTVYSTFLSYGATEDEGYRLYIENKQSILEIDMVKQRLYPEPITHAQLENLITNKKLLPKKYYNIMDFLNPWEVTWENEPFFYEDLYEEINEVQHLKGKRNAMQLIVKAKSPSELELQAWSPANPEWIIHYDPLFKGPEHITIKDEKEVTYYGYRIKENETKDENGNVIEKEYIYLPCKGRITYLKDEFGNEGDFNFRQFMFKTKSNNWRHIVDKIGNTDEHFGIFDGGNNKFYIGALETRVLVFSFEPIANSLGDTIGYSVKDIESENIIVKGHYLSIQKCILVVGNTFDLKYVDIPIIHTFSANIINHNQFLKIDHSITCEVDLNDNIFDDILGTLAIKGLECNGNTLRKINEGVYIKEGTIFNNNILTNFTKWMNNEKTFVGNTINLCSGMLNNTDTMTNNSINSITGTLTNNLLMNNNLFDTVFNLENKGIFENNKIDIVNSITNNATTTNNIFTTIEDMTNTGVITNNIIDFIKSINNTGIIDNNTITNINESLINDSNGELSNNSILNINKTLSNNFKFLNNTINVIDDLTINANIQNNVFNSIKQSKINKDITGNSVTDIIECEFNGECYNNIFRETITKCNFGIFSDNKVYKDLNECIFNEGNISSCIFNKSVTKLTIADTVYGCTYNYINNLELNKPVYYTTFHGNIGTISRELTDYEWELLADPSKKTDAYPNIRVVCVPEIIKKGMILMWYGKEEIPKGWALCDGSNGTPDLRNRFIKAVDGDGKGNPTDSVGEVDNEDVKWNDQNESVLELKTKNLPKHRHPHIHDMSNLSGTANESGSLSMSFNWTDYNWGLSSSTTSVVSSVSGEGIDSSTTSVVSSVSALTQGGTTTGGSHTHDVTINGGNIQENTEAQDSWLYNDPPTPIKLEPKHYKLIFIMKIDENPEE